MDTPLPVIDTPTTPEQDTQYTSSSVPVLAPVLSLLTPTRLPLPPQPEPSCPPQSPTEETVPLLANIEPKKGKKRKDKTTPLQAARPSRLSSRNPKPPTAIKNSSVAKR